MVPTYVQKTLDLVDATTFTTSPLVVGPEGEETIGTLYEINKWIYCYQIIIWDKGVHEFTVCDPSNVIFYQCDLGLERDYQAFEEFVKDIM